MSQALSAETPQKRKPVRKDDLIQIRASAETKVLLNQAAALRGQKLSEFMLDCARRQAEEALLDPDAHDRFLALLDAPTLPSADHRQRLTRVAPWKR